LHTIRVLLVDDYQVVLDGLQRMLAMDETIEIVGIAQSGEEAISKAILDLLSRRHTKASMMCCALSGIASDRIRKATGYNAGTIQSLLVKANKEKSKLSRAQMLFFIASRLLLEQRVETALRYLLLVKEIDRRDLPEKRIAEDLLRRLGYED